MSEPAWESSLDGIDFGAVNYVVPSWPPPDDFPVSIRPDGRIASEYGHSIWDLSPYAKAHCNVTFGDGGPRQKHRTNADNANLLRQTMGYFIWKRRRSITAITIRNYCDVLKPVFSVPSNLPWPICASEFERFDSVVERELAPAIPASQKQLLIFLLSELWAARDELGFSLLRPAQIQKLQQLIPDYQLKQTPFIPPRIWLYADERMRAFLSDFHQNATQLEEAYNVVLDAYIKNHGSVGDARTTSISRRNPFSSEQTPRGCVNFGRFETFARDHEILDILVRWTLRPGEKWNPRNPLHSIRKLGQYFNQVLFVGSHYIEMWSGMRDSECTRLRDGCFRDEDDPEMGRLVSLRGETRKTTEDDDARWVTSPEVETAVKAMELVARLRMRAAVHDRGVDCPQELVDRPYLRTLAFEPWAFRQKDENSVSWRRPSPKRLSEWPRYCPKLFDDKSITVTAEDERIARLVEPTLNLELYGEGKLWNFTPHQFRRTLMVLMADSGEVSLESIQHQAKHLVRQQTIYYSKGYSGVRYNNQFAVELVTERVKASSRLVKALDEPYWVSAYGGEHKKAILVNLHHERSIEVIERNIQKGRSTVRSTMYGLCTRRDRCPFGGWQNYIHCPNCAEALLDARKRGRVAALGRHLHIRLKDVPKGTALEKYITQKIASTEEFMNATA